MLVRFLICAAIAIPWAFAAEQQPTLPYPMSSAVSRFVHGQLPPTAPQTFPPQPTLPPRPLVAKACSIPLLEVKPPAKTRFSMSVLPVPDAKRADRMPVLTAPVCGAPTKPGN